MKKFLTGALVLGWMAVIFAFSAQDAVESSQTSQSVSYRIAELKNRLMGQEKTEDQLLKQAERMQLVIRKGAHMSEYGLLAVLLIFHLECYDLNGRKKFLLALGLAVCYAASDEFHQLFVPGRAGRFVDVCIDSSGSLAGLLLYEGIVLFRKK